MGACRLAALVFFPLPLWAQCLTPDPACVGPGTECAALAWDASTEKNDGSALDNLAGYRVYAGCVAQGSYELEMFTVDAGVTACDYRPLPRSGTCYFQVTAFDAEGVESLNPNRVSKFMGPLMLAGPASSFEAVSFESSPPTDILDLSNTVSYAGDQSQDITLVPNGLQLNNNTWRATEETFDITPDTVLTFDFEGVSEGEIHAIGFDSDLNYSGDRFFRVWGTQPSSSIYDDFNTYTSGVESFSIPIGQYYTGSDMRLVLVNDQDNSSGSEARFTNVKVDGGP